MSRESIKEEEEERMDGWNEKKVKEIEEKK
jgi:hypothetical protein